jgi:uncharacterized protein YndB with AHSA1/START domain
MSVTNPKTKFAVDREKLQVSLARVFDAPRERVFRACTDPAQIPKWWGPAQYSTVVDVMDARVGGKWRYSQKDADGNEFAFNGEYKEIKEPEKVVATFIFEGLPEPRPVLTDTVTFEELPDGKTRMTTVTQYNNIQELEGMVASGMESGAVESWERLAELVEKAA